MVPSGNEHTVEISGDVVFLEFVGVADAADMEHILACIDAAMVSHPPARYVIADVHKLTSIAPAGRRAAANWKNRNKLRGVAIVGASPIIQGLIRLISNALALFAQRRMPLGFFATPSEAIAWLHERRRADSGR